MELEGLRGFCGAVAVFYETVACHEFRLVAVRYIGSARFKHLILLHFQARQGFRVVRPRGLEPPQNCFRQDLNLLRLPISPRSH